MKFTLPEDAIPAVNLSKKQQDELVIEAETVVHEAIAANEAFLAAGSTFEDSSWKFMRAKDGLSVYSQRRKSTGSFKKLGKLRRKGPPSSESRSMSESIKNWGSTCDEDASLSSSFASKDSKRRGVVTALHGTLGGTLDDCMFGTFAATNQAWKWRSSHINDRLDDARILATIRKPTRDDPFRFLGIKWFVRERPAMLTGILQMRDYLIMEATGFTHDSKGEKVGYFLMHSISLPDAPELSDLGIIRAKFSLCFIDRQRGPDKVEKYALSFSDPGGKIMDQVNAALTADALICAANVVDYAYIKKLTWFIKHKAKRETGSPQPSCCASCRKTFSKFALLSTASGAACQICDRFMCRKCSVVKKMTVDVSDTGAVKQCALRFCFACLVGAKEQSVWDMALNGVETCSETSKASSSR